VHYERILTTSRIALAIFAAILSVAPARAAHERVLHNFGSGDDGANPTAGLVFDAAGNLYGTTAAGGTHSGRTVFEITP